MTIIFAAGLLIFGAMNTLATKVTFEMRARGISGDMETFQKPWFGVYRMFQGMSLVMLIHFGNEISNKLKRNRVMSADYAMLGKDGAQEAPPPATPLKSYFIVAIPAALDLFGTTCTYVGLFYNSPSVWQMFRGAMVIFATVFSVLGLKRPFSQLKAFGIFIVTVALTIVGTSNMLSDSSDQEADFHLRLFGMGMILLGMFLQGGQVVVEELLMKDLQAPPMLVVGMEGVWGCVIMLVLVFPIVGRIPGSDYGGVQESLANDAYMVEHSPELQRVIGIYLVSVLTFNIAGMMVTYQLSAVHRTLLEASRTAVIWAIDLYFFYYVPSMHSFGEAWNKWSYVQLIGFVLLVLGQATYGELIKWGGYFKPSRGPQAHASPLMSSPGDPGFYFSPAAAGGDRRSPMSSPKGQLFLGVDLPCDDDVAMTVSES